MKREDLEHIIRAAADITGEHTFVVIGSQAILGQFPHAPAPLLISMEADIHPLKKPELGIQIEGAIGRGSFFDRTHGYHADGIERGLPSLPQGWEQRTIPVRNANTNHATGWCLEIHDIAAAKYSATREKDLRYTRHLWEAGMLDPNILAERIRTIHIESPEKRAHVEAVVRRQQQLHDTGKRPRPPATRTRTQLGAKPVQAPIRTEIDEAMARLKGESPQTDSEIVQTADKDRGRDR